MDFNNDLIRRTDALNMVHNFFKMKMDEVIGEREEVPAGELQPFLKDNKELSAKIKAIPRFEAVPVVHGEWLPYFQEVEIYNAGGFTERKQTGFICSKCGKGFTQRHKNFCSDCGSDMRKDVQE